MAKFKLPPADIPPIDPKTGLWTADYYDIMKGLERVGLLDLFDISATPPANLQVMIWNSTLKQFVPGAN
jgi:hypothetical protein